MKRRFISLILCCGMVTASIMPIAAEEISDALQNEEITFEENLNDEALENKAFDEEIFDEDKDAESFGEDTDNEENASNAEDNKQAFTEDEKGSFDIDEPFDSEEKSEKSENSLTLENIKNETAENAALPVLLAAVTDDSTVFSSNECLDTANNSNNYWQAYYREDGKTTPTAISVVTGDNSNIVKMIQQSISLKGGSNKEQDTALISKARWNGKAGAATRIYASVGKHLMSSGNESGVIGAAKGFRAPKTGEVEIKQENLCDNLSNQVWGTGNENGVIIEIYKNSYETKNIIYTKTIDDTTKDADGNVGVVAFEPITVSLSEGDILYFEVRAENSSTTKLNNWVHFNPVVEYTKLNPTVTAQSPSAAELEQKNMETDQVFGITYREELASVSEDNVLISGTKKDGSALAQTPSADSVTLSENNTILISFENLEMGAEYTVTLKDLSFKSFSAEDYTYSFTFKTIDEMTFETYKASDYFSADKLTNGPWKTTWRTSSEWFKQDGLSKKWLNANITVNGTTYKVGNGLTNASGANGFAIGEVVMAPGNTADNGSTLKDDYPSKTFTAPNDGIIQISANDPNGESYVYGSTGGSNTVGSTILVWKTSKNGGNPVIVWPADGNGLVLRHDADFGIAREYIEPFSVSVEKGDMLHFEVQGTKGANWWGSKVYWNPVVTYKTIAPVVTDKNFEDGKTYAPNYTFEMTFDERMTEISKSDITIDGGAYVSGAEFKNGGKTLVFSFGGIKENAKYNVKVGGLIYRAILDKSNTSSYSFGFTSGKMLEFGEIVLSGGALKAGENIVSVDVNNSESAKNVTLLVFALKGTESEYSVVSAGYTTKSVGANDSISKTINLTETDGVFLRCVLVDSLSGMKPYCEAVDLK